MAARGPAVLLVVERLLPRARIERGDDGRVGPDLVEAGRRNRGAHAVALERCAGAQEAGNLAIIGSHAGSIARRLAFVYPSSEAQVDHLVLNRPDHLLALEDNPGHGSRHRADDACLLDPEKDRNHADRQPDIADFDPRLVKRKTVAANLDPDRLTIIEAHREPP